MAILKPGWLETALSWLNWDIFAWKVYIGDAIESAIDWVLTWINVQFDLVDKAQKEAEAARDLVIQTEKLVRHDFEFQDQQIRTEVDSLDAELRSVIEDETLTLEQKILKAGQVFANWITAVFGSFVREVNRFLAWLQGRTDYIEGQVNAVAGWWGTFKSQILPDLPTKAQVEELIEKDLAATREEVNRHTNIFALSWDFFTDPVKFAYTIFDEVMRRFW